MKTTVLLHHEQLLEIQNDTRAEVAAILKASIEVLPMQHNSKQARNMK
jgi:hypothetical protein